MDKESFVRDLLSDPEGTIKAYREGGIHDDAIEKLIQQATHLEKGLRGALEVPAPSGIAANIVKGVQDSERERLVLERALMTEPEKALTQLEGDENTDELAASMARESRAFEQSLNNALAVEPPAGLANSLTEHVQRSDSGRRPNAWITAIAASVFAIVGVALIMTPRQSEAAKLRQAFSEHITHEEPGALTNFDPVSEERVVSLFQDFGAEAMQSFGDVHYARKCPIGDSRGAHVVMQQPDGPVTFLFLPDKTLAKIESFEAEGGISARMFPLANGVAAIFGHNGQPLEALDQEISSAFAQTIAATLGLKVTRQG